MSTNFNRIWMVSHSFLLKSYDQGRHLDKNANEERTFIMIICIIWWGKQKFAQWKKFVSVLPFSADHIYVFSAVSQIHLLYNKLKNTYLSVACHEPGSVQGRKILEKMGVYFVIYLRLYVLCFFYLIYFSQLSLIFELYINHKFGMLYRRKYTLWS